MGNLIQVSDLIVSLLTLFVTIYSGYLTYKLQKEKKRIARLEKYYRIAIENLQANYEIEQFLAGKLNKSHRELQAELREWMKDKNVELKRDQFRPSFFKSELTYLRK
ncbi:hypothetical protein [uncultured Winogradskyella sp.]|mgnify:CR=1 FL=1|uniref:hypothetical protein n=1 Tax=uncultured Winogradskyella sp. TaxID=395353 RepID=UPI003514A08D